MDVHIYITNIRPPFKEAMAKARALCLEYWPVSRKEAFSVYRQSRSGSIFFRCHVGTKLVHRAK